MKIIQTIKNYFKKENLYLDIYKIPGAINLDTNVCFSNKNTYPKFQERLEEYKSFLKKIFLDKRSYTFYKFGDGDYFFLKKKPNGSAEPKKRALSLNYNEINHKLFMEGAHMCDFYSCEIYPENKKMFNKIFNKKKIDYPAEFNYGLISNKWIFHEFKGKIGLIGAGPKIKIIQQLMLNKKYQKYLGLDRFEDYVSIPQKYACDNINLTEKIVAEQLKKSSSRIFLMGIGHVKSALIHRLPNYRNAIYLDVGSGIDAIAGMIDIYRPFFGDWTNFRFKDETLYDEIDYLGYSKRGKHIYI
jgi:hypothetical protein